MNKAEEASLVRGLQNNEGDAQNRLWATFADSVTQWTYMQGAKFEQDVEDIMVETFLRAYRSIGGFNGKCRLKTWLFKLAKNAAIDYFRSPKHTSPAMTIDPSVLNDRWVSPNGNHRRQMEQNLLHEDSPHYGTVVDSTNQEMERMATDERLSRIRQAFLSLSEEHRKIIHLRWIEDFSVAETAEMLNKTKGAVKMQTKRALEALHAHLTRDPYFKVEGHSKEVATHDR